jgi:hypothetical protein
MNVERFDRLAFYDEVQEKYEVLFEELKATQRRLGERK